MNFAALNYVHDLAEQARVDGKDVNTPFILGLVVGAHTHIFDAPPENPYKSDAVKPNHDVEMDFCEGLRFAIVKLDAKRVRGAALNDAIFARIWGDIFGGSPKAGKKGAARGA